MDEADEMLSRLIESRHIRISEPQPPPRTERKLRFENYEEQDLSSESFNGDNLEGARFAYCRTFNDAGSMELKNCNLRFTTFSNVILDGRFSLKSNTFGGTIFDEVVLDGQDFTCTDLERCTFIACPMDGVKFFHEHADVQWMAANLRETRFVDIDFRGADVKLGPCDLFGARFVRCTFGREIFRHKDLRFCKFIDCDLRRVDMTGANIAHALMRGNRGFDAKWCKNHDTQDISLSDIIDVKDDSEAEIISLQEERLKRQVHCA
jgi:uncharacterized protein YjbI with pentapeptide repeats